jgi:hypothetical protein
MSWTTSHQAVLDAYARRRPCPGGPGQDESARAWTHGCAEQFAFSFPGEGWGHKSAGEGRPPSTDVIATRSPFLGYDLIHAQGTPGWALASMPRPIDLAGQVFLDVSAVNHIGAIGPIDPPPSDDLATRVAALEQWARGIAYQGGRTAVPGEAHDPARL